MYWANIEILVFQGAASTVAFAIGLSVCFGSESAKSIGPKSGRPQAQTASMNDVFPASVDDRSWRIPDTFVLQQLLFYGGSSHCQLYGCTLHYSVSLSFT